MGWECPHLQWHGKGRTATPVCTLDKNTCSPGQGICVLKGKFKISSVDDQDTGRSTDPDQH